jgi:peptide subunit release factor 1 (eRF1)
MDLHARLTELAKVTAAPAPVVSVYLNTRWADEHQRGRVRVFLKNELARAREAGGAALADLDWIEREGESLVNQERFPEAHGVAMFACHALELREVLPVKAPFTDRFVVADAPFVAPLATMLEQVLSALVVFIDTESARLIPVGSQGAGEEVVLTGEVPGRHSRGGWAQMAQSRYQRHIQEHRSRHFDAVAESLVKLVAEHGVERIAMAGEQKNVTVFRKSLPPRIARLIVGTVAGARYEPSSLIVARAVELLGHLEGQNQGVEVDAALTEAAKSKQAVAGLEETIDAVNRGAVHHLYVLRTFSEIGGICSGCEALQRGAAPTCHLCGQATKPTDLGAAMADRVVDNGGKVESVEIHQGLGRIGGVAAILRYPL